MPPKEANKAAKDAPAAASLAPPAENAAAPPPADPAFPLHLTHLTHQHTDALQQAMQLLGDHSNISPAAAKLIATTFRGYLDTAFRSLGSLADLSSGASASSLARGICEGVWLTEVRHGIETEVMGRVMRLRDRVRWETMPALGKKLESLSAAAEAPSSPPAAKKGQAAQPPVPEVSAEDREKEKRRVVECQVALLLAVADVYCAMVRHSLAGAASAEQLAMTSPLHWGREAYAAITHAEHLLSTQLPQKVCPSYHPLLFRAALGMKTLDDTLIDSYQMESYSMDPFHQFVSSAVDSILIDFAEEPEDDIEDEVEEEEEGESPPSPPAIPHEEGTETETHEEGGLVGRLDEAVRLMGASEQTGDMIEEVLEVLGECRGLLLQKCPALDACA
ncbi:unnamed protein product [Vitrella brassicaformis CCMP3155]|uniref:Uncharacterized protein n=1 Tax=Vitrella brassicaformis (strain CCMP3155) TaxID=1169540 RepID=A0A0G4GZE8_VITBC|nr:unnamed protein product [Vitrella brassicaformis CCMP3155]|eukprot:CEM36364.1 unnamed protein product [Vitrella brassicaformis CCMP3155]